MSVCTRRLFLAFFAGFLGLSLGCDAATLAYFFMPEGREPAKMKSVASKDPKKDSRVVILTWTGLETRSEFIHADRELSERLATALRAMAEDNQEKLTMIPSRKVEEYKNSHPNWRAVDLAQIGRHFDADYLIYLEINALSMYETGSSHTLFRGRAQLHLNLVDVKHPDDTPSQEAFSCVYPSDARGSIPILDKTQMEFRQDFLTHVAKKVSYYFSCYPKRDSYRLAE